MVICFYIALFAVLLHVFLNYVLDWVWPFLIAAAIGMLVQPIIRFLNKKLKFPNKLAAAIVVILIYFVVGYAVFSILYKIIAELTALASSVPAFIQQLNLNLGTIEESVKELIAQLPFRDAESWFEPLWTNLTGSLINAITNFSSGLLSNLPALAVKLVQFFPSLLLALVIMIVATVYFSSDHNRIWGFFKFQFSDGVKAKLRSVKEHFMETIIRYLRAYILILFITAVELYLGLTLIGQKYALILAIAIALIDVLPVLGTGTVLIPWGVILLFTDSIGKGVAILLLYVFVTVVRQILEPKIIGEYIGLYPLVTLVAMYVGLQAFGIVGMFVFPITIIILKNLNDNGSIHLWKMPPSDDNDKKENAVKRFFKGLSTKKKKGEKYKAETKNCRPEDKKE